MFKRAASAQTHVNDEREQATDSRDDQSAKWLRPVSQCVITTASQGTQLYRVGENPVIAVVGSTPFWRDLWLQATRGLMLPSSTRCSSIPATSAPSDAFEARPRMLR